MKPPQDAERIIFDVSGRVEVDRDRLRELVGERFVPGAYWHDLIEAERVAGEVVEDALEAAMMGRRRGDRASLFYEFNLDDRIPKDHLLRRIDGFVTAALADVHELYLVQAARVLEAQQDLHDNGSESWIARAVMHQQAFQLAWDVLEEKGLLTELD